MANAKIQLLLDLKDRISQGLNRAKTAVSEASEEMKKKLGGLKNYWVDAFKEMREQIPAFDQAVKFITNPIGAAVTVVTGLGGAIKSVVSSAMDWQKGMAEINVTAGLSREELEKLSKTMLDIGSKNVAPLEEVPTAFNKIISAGLTANDALAALDPTLKAAKAGFVDIETVAKAGVNVMNSSGRDINAVYDILFGTLQKGAASMGEIAAYLPTVVPVARNAGASLEETAGAFAFMTAQGQSASAAATLLNGAFNSLSNPKLLGNFKTMGVEIYDAQGKMRPMGDIIETLANKLDGLSDKEKAAKLSSLGLDQTSASAFAVMTQDVQKFKATLDGTANSTGALSAAYKNSMTAADQWGIALNNIKAVAIKIGQAFLPIITKTGEWAAAITSGIIPAIKGVVEWCKEWWPVLAMLAVGFVAMNVNNIAATASLIAHSVATKACAAAQWLLNAAMSANPIGLVVMAIAALVAMVTIAIKKYDEWGAAMLLLMGPIGMIVNLVMTIKRYWDSITDAFTNGGFIEGVKQIGRALLDLILYPVQQLLELLSKIPGAGKLAAKGFDFIKEMRANLNMIDPEKKTQSAPSETDETEDKSLVEQGMEMLGFGNGGLTGDVPGSGGGSATGGADAVAGSAKQIKNITVNIDAFNKGGINAGNTQGLNGKSATDIEEWFTQMLLRTVRNLETSY